VIANRTAYGLQYSYRPSLSGIAVVSMSIYSFTVSRLLMPVSFLAGCCVLSLNDTFAENKAVATTTTWSIIFIFHYVKIILKVQEKIKNTNTKRRENTQKDHAVRYLSRH